MTSGENKKIMESPSEERYMQARRNTDTRGEFME
jgi:hypothetical protein